MGLKRLNTFIPEETHRKLKVSAASTGQTIAQVIESLVDDVLYKTLPASGSRPESAAADTTISPAALPASGVAAGIQSSREELLDPRKFGEGGRHVDLMVEDDLIVRCGLCGQEMPQSAREIHEENCRKSQQGYWDRKAFSV